MPKILRYIGLATITGLLALFGLVWGGAGNHYGLALALTMASLCFLYTYKLLAEIHDG